MTLLAGDNHDATSDFDSVFNVILGGNAAQVVRSLAFFSVAEQLDSGPLGSIQIARQVSADPSAMHRLLRAAAALRFVDYDAAAKTFSGLPLLELLHQDGPESLKNFALMAGSQPAWTPAMGLPQAVADGGMQAVESLGTPYFEVLRQNPEQAELFSSAMTDLSKSVIQEAVPLIEVSTDAFVVDVGGSKGTFVQELLKRHDGLRGAVYDLTHVVPGALAEAARQGLTDRFEGIGGDFFVSVPSADIYLLKFILHDWSDADCLTLLTNIRQAMKPGARVFVVELLVDDENPAFDAAMMDITMLYLQGGRERTAEEFNSLLNEADLTVSRQRRLRGSYALIEATAT